MQIHLFYNAGAATNQTIVDAWSRDTPQQIINLGRRAIDSTSEHWYFTEAVPGGPAGWSICWYDMSTGVNPASM
jgi:hypothetical protein